MILSKVAVGDADSLIALAYSDDANHDKAKQVSKRLLSRGYEIIYPNTAILEAITTLRRALNLPDKAQLINKQYQKGAFNVIYVDQKIQERASVIFESTVSKQNTIFDAVVAATYEEFSADRVFSFDEWYKNRKMKLAQDLV